MGLYLADNSMIDFAWCTTLKAGKLSWFENENYERLHVTIKKVSDKSLLNPHLAADLETELKDLGSSRFT